MNGVYSGVGSRVAQGARAPPPCWIVLESFHKRETCFAGRTFRAWSGGPIYIAFAEPLRAIERAWRNSFDRRMRLELCCHSGYYYF